MFEVVAGIVFYHLVEAGNYRTVGKHRLEAKHHVTHHAVTDDSIAAGVGRNVATDSTRAARADVERK